MTSHIKQPPQAVGLYDPRFEHDACGVGMVARLDNTAHPRGHLAGDHGAGEPRASRRHRRRPVHRRRRRDPHADARRAAARRGRLRAAAAGRLRRADVLPADRATAPARAPRRAARAAPSPRRASECSAGATCPIDAEQTGEVAGACRPVIRQLFVGAGRRRGEHDQDAFERKLYVIRRDLRADGAGAGPVRRLELVAHDQLQGHADQLPAGGLLPRPARRARQERAGARALALLDQHVPQLGARAPLPRDLPQRRDQHGDGQRQLDARAREPAAQRAVRRGPAQDPAGRRARQLRLGDVRQRARAADARRPLAAARGDDDDPRGLPRPRRPARVPEGLLRLPLLPDGALGRPAVGRLHRRARRRRDARPQRPAARPLGGDDRRATSCSARSPACWTSRPRRSAGSVACSRASCSWSTSSAAASSRTRRSSARSPRAGPTASGTRATRCRFSELPPSRR